MKDKITRMAVLLLLFISVTSCAHVKGIFEAGMGAGVVIVVVLVVVLLYAVRKILGNKK